MLDKNLIKRLRAVNPFILLDFALANLFSNGISKSADVVYVSNEQNHEELVLGVHVGDVDGAPDAQNRYSERCAAVLHIASDDYAEYIVFDEYLAWLKEQGR